MGFINDKKVISRLNELAEILQIDTPEFLQCDINEKLDAVQKAIENLCQEKQLASTPEPSKSNNPDSTSNSFSSYDTDFQKVILATVKSQKEKITNLEEELNQLNSEIEEKDSKIAQLQQDVQQYKGHIQKLALENNRFVDKYNGLTKETERLKAALVISERLNEEKEAQISDLRQSSEESKNQLLAFKREVDGSEEKILTLNIEIQELQKNIQKLIKENETLKAMGSDKSERSTTEQMELRSKFEEERKKFRAQIEDRRAISSKDSRESKLGQNEG